MRIVHVIPRRESGVSLKSLMNEKERSLRGKGTTFIRSKAGRWVHRSLPGWINWDETSSSAIEAVIQCRVPNSDWRLTHAFVGYLDRHFADEIESITITFR